MLITYFRHGLRKNSAPVKGPKKGILASSAMGTTAFDVGVPTSPTNRNTFSFSMSSRTFLTARSGS